MIDNEMRKFAELLMQIDDDKQKELLFMLKGANAVKNRIA